MTTAAVMTSSTDKKSSINSNISLAKDMFALVRDITLAAIAILLLIFPATFNDRLVKAGFESGNFVGLSWKAKLENSDIGLKEARIQINDLNTRLKLTTDKLKEAEGKINDAQFKADVGKLDSRNNVVSAAATKVASDVSSLIAVNTPSLERAQESVVGNWGVIYSGDTSLELAKYEVGTVASMYGIPNPTIFMDKNGSYRSVAIVKTLEDAKDALARAKKRRSDAYIVRMSAWCPNQIQKEGYRVCSVV